MSIRGSNVRHRELPTISMLACVAIAISIIISHPYLQRVMLLVIVWATMAQAWNIIGGYAGCVSFGHQAFLGIGAYVPVLLMTSYYTSPWIGMFVGAVIAALAAIIIGIPTLRLSGLYFGLATLAYPLIFKIGVDFTGYQEVIIPTVRSSGLLFMQFQDPRAYTWLALAILLGTTILSYAIEHSRLGYSLRALKEDEQAAAAMGVNVYRAKLVAFTLSAVPTAMIGTVYAFSVLYVISSEAVFGLNIVALTLTIAFVGGVGNKWGPIIGAMIMIPTSEALDATMGEKLPGIQGIVLGCGLVLVILFAPEGIFWRAREILAKLRTRVVGRVAWSDKRSLIPVRLTYGLNEEKTEEGSILTVRELAKSFHGLRVLETVTFDVLHQEILGIIGPNGAGKTTLFNILNGFHRPDNGVVVFCGQVITGLLPHSICRLGVGRTFQVVRKFEQLTVLENVMVAAFARGVSEHEARGLAMFAIATVDMQEQADAPIGKLTTLDLRRMELARCIASGPRLALLDEPLAGLGSDGITIIVKLIRRLRSLGLTIIIIEHTMHALLQLADRLIVLDGGCVVAEGAPRRVIGDPRVVEAYLGKKWVKRAEAIGA